MTDHTSTAPTTRRAVLAGATVVIIPILALFLVLQRRVIEGIATTGIK